MAASQHYECRVCRRKFKRDSITFDDMNRYDGDLDEQVMSLIGESWVGAHCTDGCDNFEGVLHFNGVPCPSKRCTGKILVFVHFEVNAAFDNCVLRELTESDYVVTWPQNISIKCTSRWV